MAPFRPNGQQEAKLGLDRAKKKNTKNRWKILMRHVVAIIGPARQSVFGISKRGKCRSNG